MESSENMWLNRLLRARLRFALVYDCTFLGFMSYNLRYSGEVEAERKEMQQE